MIRAYVVKIFDKVFQAHGLAGGGITNSTAVMDECSSSPEHHKTSSMAYLSAMVIGVCRLLSSLLLAR